MLRLMATMLAFLKRWHWANYVAVLGIVISLNTMITQWGVIKGVSLAVVITLPAVVSGLIIRRKFLARNAQGADDA